MIAKIVSHLLAVAKRIPSGVWILGFVSLFTDISAELIYSILPIFMVSVLHISVATIGLIEGIAEATALIVKLFSGILSDILKRRKPLAVIGYATSACARLILLAAHSAFIIGTARFFDRLGKGIRDAPRDALLGDIAPRDMRGASFGIRQGLDTVGAIVGPLLGLVLILIFTNNNIRFVFFLAALPAFLSVILLLIGVHEPKMHHAIDEKVSFTLKHIWQFDRAYWRLMIINVLLRFARLGNFFLLLRAQSMGIATFWIPIVMVVMNTVYAFSSYPAGTLSDYIGRYKVLLFSLIFLLCANIIFIFDYGIPFFMLGVILFGLHMGFAEGLISALVTDYTPSIIRGTGYGMMNVLAGGALLCAHYITGSLWDLYGASMVFTGATICSCIITTYVFLQRE